MLKSCADNGTDIEFTEIVAEFVKSKPFAENPSDYYALYDKQDNKTMHFGTSPVIFETLQKLLLSHLYGKEKYKLS